MTKEVKPKPKPASPEAIKRATDFDRCAEDQDKFKKWIERSI